jgi:hypothetical protein
MPRRRLLLLALSCGLLGPVSDLAQSAAQPPPETEPLRLGMTANQVRDLLGPPTNISRRVILYRTHEQWHYDKLGLRLSFDHPRGATARLVQIAMRDRGG